MARKNPLVKPLHKLKDTALGAISDPKGTADKVVEQAKGAASLGKMVAEGVAGEVVSRTRGRKATDAPSAETAPARPATAPPTKKQGDPLAPAAKSAEPSVDKSDKSAAKKATPADVAKKAAKKAPAKKTATKKAPAKKTATKKAAAKKTPTKKAAAKKPPAKKSAQGSPGDKLPPRRRTASAAEVAEGGPGVQTPVGTTGAAPGTNPDTAESDLQQPGTERIVEPGTAKEIAKEAERGRRGAEGNAG